jgi:hypothetical protein
MKKHHSIFGTKSIPDYRKKEFRKGRNRRHADKISNDYEAWNDENSYGEGSYSEEPYSEESYNEESYNSESYDEAAYNKES